MTEYVPTDSFSALIKPMFTALVTTCDKNGRANIIAIAWVMPLSKEPPLLGIAVRKDRYSYELICQTPEFVVNVPTFEIARQTLFCGRRTGRKLDKFEAAGLTAGKARLVRPPTILECAAHIECRLVKEVKTGDHQLLVGEVLAAYTRAEIANAKGLPDLQRIQPLLHLGNDVFTTISAQTVEPHLD